MNAVHAVNLITTCRGRLEHLKRSIPTMLAQHADCRWWVTVVDYGDPDDAFGWCQRQAHPRLQAIKVLEGVEFYSHGRARNFGAVRSSADLLCLLDADSLLSTAWLATILDLVGRGHNACLPKEMVANWSGMFAVRSWLFHAARGYDESFAGWGYDDTDLYQRIEQHGADVGRFDLTIAEMIEHGNDLRVNNYREQDAAVSFYQNWERTQVAGRGPVNPAGYGLGQCLYWRAPQACMTASGLP